MLREILETLIGVAWVTLSFIWFLCAGYALQLWFGRAQNTLTIALGFIWLLSLCWSTAVTPAVVSFTLGR